MDKLEVSLEILKLAVSNPPFQNLSEDQRLEKLLVNFEVIYQKIASLSGDRQFIPKGELIEAADGTRIGEKPGDEEKKHKIGEKPDEEPDDEDK